jgi:hypothetical protein
MQNGAALYHRRVLCSTRAEPPRECRPGARATDFRQSVATAVAGVGRRMSA